MTERLERLENEAFNLSPEYGEKVKAVLREHLGEWNGNRERYEEMIDDYELVIVIGISPDVAPECERFGYLSIRNALKLEKCLECIADTAKQSIARPASLKLASLLAESAALSAQKLMNEMSEEESE